MKPLGFVPIIVVFAALAARAMDLFVAPGGNDDWSGRRAAPSWSRTDGPFATLERARDEVRRLKHQGGLPAGGLTVHVRGGRYPVKQTLTLDAADSGTEQTPIVYRAFRHETPIFSGGVRLTGFQPVRDGAILERLPENARSKVWQVDLAANGVTNLLPIRLGGYANGLGFITYPVMELFFNGRALPLARWPNAGFVRIAAVSTNDGPSSSGAEGGQRVRLTYEGDRPARWTQDQDVVLFGYWSWDWADSYERVESIDTNRHEFTLAPPFHRFGYRQGQRYCAINLLSEIDRPGEWYLDRRTGMLYLYVTCRTWPDRMVGRFGVPCSGTACTVPGASPAYRLAQADTKR